MLVIEAVLIKGRQRDIDLVGDCNVIVSVL